MKQKYPVTANILSALTLTLPKESPYRTLYNLLFFGLPRVGNILPMTTSRFSILKHLTWDKIMHRESGVIITLQVTKTIQNFERLLRIPIAASDNRKQFCVKRGLETLKKLPDYPTGNKDPVFCVFEGGIWKPLCKKRFSTFFKSHLRYLGLDCSLITPSSFRKGGLSHMLLKVGNMELLRLQGDWLSDAYKRYIVIPAESRFSVTEKALEGMP